MLLANLEVILVRPRFPENIGMAARACANMGCPSLCLVEPELRKPEKEAALATSGGLKILQNMRICDTVPQGVENANIVYGTTARTGGWRRTISAPWQAAGEIAHALAGGMKICLLFGSEDRGLENREILSCSSLIHIPTFGAKSLNLAQAVLLTLYECSRAVSQMADANKRTEAISFARIRELSLLEKELKECLLLLDCVGGKNPDYHFQQWHGILARAHLRRHEFDALMGFCRQLKNRLDRK